MSDGKEYRVLYDEPGATRITPPWTAYQGTDEEEALRLFNDVKSDVYETGLEWNVQLQYRYVSSWETDRAVLSGETVHEVLTESKGDA